MSAVDRAARAAPSRAELAGADGAHTHALVGARSSCARSRRVGAGGLGPAGRVPHRLLADLHARAGRRCRRAAARRRRRPRAVRPRAPPRRSARSPRRAARRRRPARRRPPTRRASRRRRRRRRRRRTSSGSRPRGSGTTSRSNRSACRSASTRAASPSPLLGHFTSLRCDGRGFLPGSGDEGGSGSLRPPRRRLRARRRAAGVLLHLAGRSGCLPATRRRCRRSRR